jgi:hypothetical protein
VLLLAEGGDRRAGRAESSAPRLPPSRSCSGLDSLLDMPTRLAVADRAAPPRRSVWRGQGTSAGPLPICHAEAMSDRSSATGMSASATGMSDPGASPAIEFEGVSRTYRSSGGVETHALVDVDLAVAVGEMVAIMGASGSGKSTMMVLGLLDRGRVGPTDSSMSDAVGGLQPKFVTGRSVSCFSSSICFGGRPCWTMCCCRPCQVENRPRGHWT